MYIRRIGCNFVVETKWYIYAVRKNVDKIDPITILKLLLLSKVKTLKIIIRKNYSNSNSYFYL